MTKASGTVLFSSFDCGLSTNEGSGATIRAVSSWSGVSDVPTAATAYIGFKD